MAVYSPKLTHHLLVTSIHREPAHLYPQLSVCISCLVIHLPFLLPNQSKRVIPKILLPTRWSLFSFGHEPTKKESSFSFILTEKILLFLMPIMMDSIKQNQPCVRHFINKHKNTSLTHQEFSSHL